MLAAARDHVAGNTIRLDLDDDDAPPEQTVTATTQTPPDDPDAGQGGIARPTTYAAAASLQPGPATPTAGRPAPRPMRLMFPSEPQTVTPAPPSDPHTKKHSVYLIRHTPTDRVYIGQTTQSLNRRFRQHMTNPNRRLAQVLRTEPSAAFRLELLHQTTSKAVANVLERRHIAEHQSTTSKGFNTLASAHRGDPRFAYVQYFKLLKT